MKKMAITYWKQHNLHILGKKKEIYKKNDCVKHFVTT